MIYLSKDNSSPGKVNTGNSPVLLLSNKNKNPQIQNCDTIEPTHEDSLIDQTEIIHQSFEPYSGVKDSSFVLLSFDLKPRRRKFSDSNRGSPSILNIILPNTQEKEDSHLLSEPLVQNAGD
ncbi:hypothetical protein NPIL_286861 [Nephila pilipes]|uniref:Uncharacterized protein n=1 Tax=Nephila pilipes TaxID=299642 RepID=A0A8X6THA9_NEPPI|nr:hypothetical protein NPIL_286861 [Nephila pilipes]